MSALLDICIIAIIVLSIVFAVKNGFIKTLLGGTSFLLALVIAFLLLSPVKQLFINSSVADKARESLSETLAGYVSSEADKYDPTAVKESSGFETMLKVFGIDTEDFEAKWQEWRTENTEKLRADLEEYISEPVVNAVATVVAFLILFFGSLLLLKLALFLLDRFVRLPGLKQANTALGVVLGIILAAVRVYLFVAVVNMLIPYGNELGWRFFSELNTSDTFLFGWFCEHNLFSIFFG